MLKKNNSSYNQKEEFFEGESLHVKLKKNYNGEIVQENYNTELVEESSEQNDIIKRIKFFNISKEEFDFVEKKINDYFKNNKEKIISEMKFLNKNAFVSLIKQMNFNAKEKINEDLPSLFELILKPEFFKKYIYLNSIIKNNESFFLSKENNFIPFLYMDMDSYSDYVVISKNNFEIEKENILKALLSNILEVSLIKENIFDQKSDKSCDFFNLKEQFEFEYILNEKKSQEKLQSLKIKFEELLAKRFNYRDVLNKKFKSKDLSRYNLLLDYYNKIFNFELIERIFQNRIGMTGSSFKNFIFKEMCETNIVDILKSNILSDVKNDKKIIDEDSMYVQKKEFQSFLSLEQIKVLFDIKEKEEKESEIFPNLEKIEKYLVFEKISNLYKDLNNLTDNDGIVKIIKLWVLYLIHEGDSFNEENISIIENLKNKYPYIREIIDNIVASLELIHGYEFFTKKEDCFMFTFSKKSIELFLGDIKSYKSSLFTFTECDDKINLVIFADSKLKEFFKIGEFFYQLSFIDKKEGLPKLIRQELISAEISYKENQNQPDNNKSNNERKKI